MYFFNNIIKMLTKFGNNSRMVIDFSY